MLYHIMLLFSKISNMLLIKCVREGGGVFKVLFLFFLYVNEGKKILPREKKRGGAGGGMGARDCPDFSLRCFMHHLTNILMKIRHVNLCIFPRRFALFLEVGLPQNRDGIINMSIEKFKRLKLKVGINVNENYTRTIRGFIAITTMNSFTTNTFPPEKKNIKQ